MHEYDLFCLIEYDSEPFSIKVSTDETVENLKKSIIMEGLPELSDLHPRDLKLWQVDRQRNEIKPGELENDNSLDPTWKINRYWEAKPHDERIHVYIRIQGKWIAGDPPILSVLSSRYMLAKFSALDWKGKKLTSKGNHTLSSSTSL